MVRAVFTFFSSLFRRDGLATVGKIFFYALSPRAWCWLFKNLRYRRIVKAAGLVDESWYRREYPEVAEKGIDPVQDFLMPPHPWTRMPNPDFVPGEYAAVNYDVKACGVLWAVHYAKDGMREGRPVSTLENCEKPFPVGAVELRREFAPVSPVHRRTAVFASFSGDGRIQETVLYYLRGLREVVDSIVLVANNPIFPDEIGKLDGLVRLAVFRHHGCYDFGSYKMGWNEAKALGLLEPDVCDELVVCNDSCYGPVFPFSGAFAEMDRRNRKAKPDGRFDFWGMTAMRIYGRDAIQSFFYVFGKSVLEGNNLDKWFSNLPEYRDRGRVVFNCESMLTNDLANSGFRWDSLVPESFHLKKKATPTKHPLALLHDFRMPLVKAKALKGDCLDDMSAIRTFLAGANPDLAGLLHPEAVSVQGKRRSPAKTAREIHVPSLPRKVAAIRAARGEGSPLRILFLTVSTASIPQRPWLDAFCGESGFRTRIAVVPDLRIADFSGRLSAMRAARAALFATFGRDRVVKPETDSADEWSDLTADADVVCWETAEDASDFHYNPHYAVGRDFLPVLFFDRRMAGPYPLEKEFARQNYAYFWRIFFADREAFDLYAKHSIRGGENAVFANDLADSFLRLLSFA